jgi:hypothetical protein
MTRLQSTGKNFVLFLCVPRRVRGRNSPVKAKLAVSVCPVHDFAQSGLSPGYHGNAFLESPRAVSDSA